jgi:hypothetical protein
MDLKELISAIDSLSNRKGVVYLVLLTLVLAVGPSEVFVAANALYLSLPFSKLMLMSFGLTLPPLVVGVAIFLMTRRAEQFDRLAVRGIVITSCVITCCGLIAIAYTWIRGGGAQPYVICVSAGIALILVLEYDEKRKWERDIEEGNRTFDEDDAAHFALSRRDEFFAWKAARDEKAKAEKLMGND